MALNSACRVAAVIIKRRRAIFILCSAALIWLLLLYLQMDCCGQGKTKIVYMNTCNSSTDSEADNANLTSQIYGQDLFRHYDDTGNGMDEVTGDITGESSPGDDEVIEFTSMNRSAALRYMMPFLSRSWDPGLAVEGSLERPLPGYSNPCWRERLPNGPLFTLYRHNHYIAYLKERRSSQQVAQVNQAWNGLVKVLRRREQSESRNWRLRCLPGVYLAGWHKAGTTDLYDTLIKHPLVVKSVIKESGFFSRMLGAGITFRDYLELYDPVAERIRNTPGALTIDATPETYMMWNWTEYDIGVAPQGDPLFFASYIRAMTPGAKVIFLVRDPVTWLFSNYRHVNRRRKQSPEDFDACVRRQLAVFHQCMTDDAGTVRRCALMRVSKDECPVQHAIYYVYIEKWLEIFPREQILVLRAEDYYDDREVTLRKVVDFLSLRPFNGEHLQRVSGRKVSNVGGHARSSMLPATRRTILDFVRPFNDRLARILGDTRFLWKDQTYV